MGLSASIHGFLFFMFVNGAIVFADGWMRLLGIVAVGAVSIAWSTKLFEQKVRGAVTARRFYYGWVVLGVAALAMVGTLPGRTQGLGLITEPLLRDLGVSRIAYAQINLVATLVGALFAFGVGSLIDRRGSRLVLTAIAVALGIVVLAMSQVTSATALLVFITLTRGLGQTALSIVSLAMVGKWFRRRLTWAMGTLRAGDERRLHDRVSHRRRGRARRAVGAPPGPRSALRSSWSWRRSRGCSCDRRRRASAQEMDGDAMDDRAECAVSTSDWTLGEALAYAGVLDLRAGQLALRAGRVRHRACSTSRFSPSAGSRRTCITTRWRSRRSPGLAAISSPAPGPSADRSGACSSSR